MSRGYSILFGITLITICVCVVQSIALYNQDKYKRHIINEYDVPVNLEWLTDEQLSELGSLDNVSQIQKIQQFYDLLIKPEEKKVAAKKIFAQAYNWLPEVASETEQVELKEIREKNYTFYQERIRVLVSKLNEQKKSQLLKYLKFFEQVWNDTIKHVNSITDISENNDKEKEEIVHQNTTIIEKKAVNENETTIKNNNLQKRNINNKNLIKRRYRRNHHHNHQYIEDLEHCFKTHLSWLTDAQKDELRSMKASGSDRVAIKTKIFDIYSKTSGDIKKKALEQLKSGCSEMFVSVFGKEKYEEVKKLKESGTSVKKISTMIKKSIDEIKDEKKKEIFKEYGTECEKLFAENLAARKRRHHEHHSLEDYIKSHLSWLTDAQKDELRSMKASGNDRVAIKTKIFDFYSKTSGDIKKNALEQLKSGCSEMFVSVFGKEKYEEVKKLKESGTSVKEISTMIKKSIDEIKDEKKKEIFKEYGTECEKLFAENLAARKRRHHEEHNHHEHHSLEDYIKSHLSWLTDAQKDELRSMKASGSDRVAIKTKIFDFYSKTSGDIKKNALEQLKSGCSEMFVSVFGKEKYEEVKKLKESGTSVKEISSMIKKSIDEIKDEKKKEIFKEYGTECEKLFAENLAARKRRHHEHHSLEDYIKSHLSWLTDAQKDELRSMKASGSDRVAIKTKIFDIYSKTSGDIKKKALEQLKSGCSEMFVSVFGKEKYEEVKKLKESGTSVKKISTMIKKSIDEIKDEKKKEIFKEYGTECEKLFAENLAARKRRHHEHHSLEDYIKSHLSWLTDAQKDELRSMKASGNDRVAIKTKIFDFYSKTSGDIKKNALEQLKSGCSEMFVSVFGKEKYEEVKKLKESGTSVKEISTMIKKSIDEIKDEKKKEIFKEYGTECEKLFAENLAARKRRHHEEHNHHEHHSLEDYIKSHLSWLTDAQKDELRSMKASGSDRVAIKTKIFDFYSKTSGDIKKNALEQLKSGCSEMFVSVFGKEKYEEVKKLKESGTSVKEISSMIKKSIDEIKDEKKKEIFKEYGTECEKLFAENLAARKRRHHEHHSLEDYIKSHLSWLTDAQKDELRSMKASGSDRVAIKTKIFDFYSKTSGDIKKNALEQLKSGCSEMFVSVFGKEKYEEVKKLKESGTSVKEISTMIKKSIDEIKDEKKKEIFKEYGTECEKLFAENLAARKRRHHEEHNHHEHHSLEDYIKSHLSWLTDAQKDELRSMKASGSDRVAIKTKIFDFYSKTSGDIKKNALEQLKSGCSEMFVSVFGKEKYEEVKKLKESGTSVKEISTMIKKSIDEIKDEKKKEIFKEYGTECEKLFAENLAARKRRHHEEHNHHEHHSLEDYIKSHLSWLTDAQKDELRSMKASGSDRVAIKTKIFDFYSKTSGDIKKNALEQLKSGCSEMFVSVFGKEKYEEVKKLKESGTSVKEISTMIKKSIDEIKDEKKKEIFKEYGTECEKLFAENLAARKRRHHEEHNHHEHHSLEDYIKSHLSWLTDAQKDELRSMKASGSDRVAIKTKIFDFYSKTSGDIKKNALEQLKSGCSEMFVSVFGKEKYEEVKKLKESGTSVKEISSMIKKSIDEIKDEKKKEIFKEYGTECEKLFAENLAARKRRHHDDHLLEDYFKLHWG